MIITISGMIGSGKSSVANLIAKKKKMKHYSVGDFMRKMADKRGLSLLELTEKARKDETIDNELDQMLIDLGNEEDNFVIDARLGFHFIPHSVKIFLDVSLNEGARRIFNQGRKREKENTSLARTKENMKKRIRAEKYRYKKMYNVNHFDKKNYSLVLDTTNLTKKEVMDDILEYLNQL